MCTSIFIIVHNTKLHYVRPEHLIASHQVHTAYKMFVNEKGRKAQLNKVATHIQLMSWNLTNLMPKSQTTHWLRIIPDNVCVLRQPQQNVISDHYVFWRRNQMPFPDRLGHVHTYFLVVYIKVHIGNCMLQPRGYQKLREVSERNPFARLPSYTLCPHTEV